MLDVTAPNEELARALQGHAGHLAAATCEWLEGVAEFNRRDACGDYGVTSTAAWLQLWCALDTRTAREQLRVARSLSSMPHTTSLFRAGRLSYSKVRAVSRMATPSTERDLGELALVADTAQLERLAQAYRRHMIDDDLVESRRRISFRSRDDGSGSVNLECSAEELVLLREAIERKQVQMVDSGSAEPLPSMIDAFMCLIEAGHRAEAPVSVDEPLVVVHLNADQSVEVGDGSGITDRTAERLLCNAVVQTVVERDGKALDVGRRKRPVPPRLRRALEARDRGCRHPGCRHRRFLQAHHVEFWSRDGKTNEDNCVMLCGLHHRALHRGVFRIDKRDGDFVFSTPEHGRIETKPLAGSGRKLVTGPFLYDLPSPAERMNLAYTSAAMWQ